MKKLLQLILVALVLGGTFLYLHERIGELEYKLYRLKSDVEQIKKYVTATAELEIAYMRVPGSAKGTYRAVPRVKSKSGKWIPTPVLAVPAVGPALALFYNRPDTAFYLHAIVVARHPYTGEEFYVSAGESNSGSPSGLLGASRGSFGSRRCEIKGQLCAIAETLTETSVDKRSEVLYRQRIGDTGLSFVKARREMRRYVKVINDQHIDYDVDEANCNTFSSVFLRRLTGRYVPPLPRLSFPHILPGWVTSEGDKLGLWTVFSAAR